MKNVGISGVPNSQFLTVNETSDARGRRGVVWMEGAHDLRTGCASAQLVVPFLFVRMLEISPPPIACRKRFPDTHNAYRLKTRNANA